MGDPTSTIFGSVDVVQGDFTSKGVRMNPILFYELFIDEQSSSTAVHRRCNERILVSTLEGYVDSKMGVC